MASFGRPGIVTVALCTLFGGFIAGAIVLVMPLDTVAVAKQVLVWLTLTLLALTLVYGIVHSFASARRRGMAPMQSLMPQTDIAILNWRREKSVFLGTNQPQEDASWIFQLAHGGAGAREDRPDERAAAVEPAGRAHVRLRVLGHRPRAAPVRAPQRRLRAR